ncbi:MotA/TolQ/ExbB proton channel family protein [Acuticoccus sediminis]|uniref:MotA/TolQ/ExbB proton channel family protein n=1 Tax=Acuticoccus sediminis TaxID=2184697 RepID=A0A8B2NYM0_9HYPH|nr:MotA/TolQ/ExbB proton channel family protein [Acuticoccus sediminis]RAI02986.1 MotA/TolQ/ExbB proton channel family protein [Acuticoccus sediminis]
MDGIRDILSSVEFNGLADLLELGGPVVLLLLGLSVAVATIALAKIIAFVTAGVGRHQPAREAVQLYLAGDAPAARRRASGPVSAQIVRYAIDASAAMAPEAARDATEAVAILRLHRLRAMTGLLDIIAQIAPLLGLFGTVLGMIEAFRALEDRGASVDPSVLAGGIWVALLTTAVGLAVAMPASVLTAWFEGRLESEEIAIEGLVTALFTGALPEERPGRRGRGAHEADTVPPAGPATGSPRPRRPIRSR